MTLLSETVQGQALAAMLPSGTDRWVGFFTTVPTDSVAGTEATGSGYARIANDAWVNKSSGGIVYRTNSEAIELAVLTADLDGINGWGIWDAVSGGNLIVWGPIHNMDGDEVSDKTYKSGYTPRFGKGELRVQFNNIVDDILDDDNGDFETYTNPATTPDGWAIYKSGSATVAAARTAGYAGNYGCQLTLSVGTGVYFGVRPSSASGIWDGYKPYVVSWMAKAVSGSAVGATGTLNWNHSPTKTFTALNPAMTTSWQRYMFVIVFDATTEADGFIYPVVANNVNAPGVCVVDDFSIFELDSVGYYDALPSPAEYGSILQQLLPPGKAWTIAPDGDFKALLTALGHSFERLEARGEDILREFDPNTMFELLEDWERVLALPGDNPNPPTTLSGRRVTVLAALLGNTDPTPALFEQIAQDAGYANAYVNQHILHPFVPGSVAGDPIATGWRYYWEVVTERGDDDAFLEWSLQRLAPNHTVLKVFWLINPVEQSFDTTSSTFHGVAHNGSDLWVAVGGTGSIQTSPDGETWTKRTAAGNKTLYDVAHNGSNLWCAVGAQGQIETSPDGITWTARTAAGGYTGDFQAIAHDQSGLWVAVGQTGEIQTSSNGITWIARSAAGGYTANWDGVAYGNGNWVIVGQKTTSPFDGKINMSSTGGVWSDVTPPSTAEGLVDVGYDGSSQFLIAGRSGEFLTASDEDVNDWRRRDASTTEHMRDVVYAGDRWIVIGESGEVQETWYGYDWKEHTPSFDVNGIGYYDGTCVLVGGSGKVYTAET